MPGLSESRIETFLDETGQRRTFTVTDVPANGDCLFLALSEVIYGTTEMHTAVRTACTEHVLANWEEMSVETHARDGNNYERDQYCK